MLHFLAGPVLRTHYLGQKKKKAQQPAVIELTASRVLLRRPAHYRCAKTAVLVVAIVSRLVI